MRIYGLYFAKMSNSAKIIPKINTLHRNMIFYTYPPTLSFRDSNHPSHSPVVAWPPHKVAAVLVWL